MIGVVLVSHSKALACALRDLTLQTAGAEAPVVVAAGAGDDHEDLGTDALHIMEVLRPFCEGDGAVVLMDLGSAVLSAQAALELLDAEGVPDVAAKIRLCPAPLVEAAVAAAVQAGTGADLEAVAREATLALAAKADQLGGDDDAAALSPGPETTPDAGAVTFDIAIANPHGLHARPAAALVRCAGTFDADIRLTNQSSGRGPASARSLTGIGLLQVRAGDHLHVSIQGEDAEAAAEALKALADDNFGEGETDAEAPVVPPAISVTGAEGPRGVGASDGVEFGRPLLLASAVPEPDEEPPASPEEERRKLDKALRVVAEDLGASTGGEASAILAAQALILRDPAVLEPVHARLSAGGVSARAAWRQETLAIAKAYAAMDDPYLRGRAADLRDIAARVSAALAGQGPVTSIVPDPPAVLLAEDLLPGEAMACVPGAVLGVVTRFGGPTGHAAIILRGLGVPMVVGAETVDLDRLSQAKLVALDGGTGEVWADPSPEERAEIEGRRQTFVAAQAKLAVDKDRPAATRDGARVEVLANVGSVVDAVAARDNGAEGVGLLRTEFVFLPFRERPTEDQQAEALRAVMAALGPGPVVVRTPDIGADKPLPFLPQRAERNPFLGVRGLRLSLRDPAFFASNLRAILRAGHDRDLWIMVPMVSTPEEMAQARAAVEAAHQDLEAAGIPAGGPVRIGAMIEVPAAVLTAGRLADLADFFSIGTNDLTQYLMAAERGNTDLAALQDPLHPAVLRMVRETCRAAAAAGRHVSVCGDAASDPIAATALIGAGVRSLSVRPAGIPAIKAGVRVLDAGTCGAVVDRAIAECGAAAEVRERMRAVLSGAAGDGLSA